jgi:hypothetical protein
MGQDWVVEGKLIYQRKGFSWLEYMLQDGDEICWLAVEEDDWVTVTLLAPVNSLEVSAAPPPELVYNGDTYHAERNRTSYHAPRGQSPSSQAETCRYFDYEGPDQKCSQLKIGAATWR